MAAPSPDFATLTIGTVDKATAKAMIIANHYSQTWQTLFGLVNVGVFRDGVLMGVAVYGYPMNPASWASVTTLPPEQCLELNRLWIDDALGANTETWLLAKSFTYLRGLGYRLIQSFADGRLGVGTIYQAANFSYHGVHKSVFHADTLTGVVTHSAPFSNTSVAIAMISKNRLLARGQIKTFSTNTYRYLYPLDRGARRTVKLTAQAYPKARTGTTVLADYRPPVSQVARAVALARAMDNEPAAAELIAYLGALTADPEDAVATQNENKWVKRLLAARRPMLTFEAEVEHSIIGAISEYIGDHEDLTIERIDE